METDKAYGSSQEDDDDRHDDEGTLGCAGRIDGEWDEDDEEEFSRDVDNSTQRNQQMNNSQSQHLQHLHNHQSQYHTQSINQARTPNTDGTTLQHDTSSSENQSSAHRTSQHRTTNMKGSGNSGTQFANDFDAGIML